MIWSDFGTWGCGGSDGCWGYVFGVWGGCGSGGAIFTKYISTIYNFLCTKPYMMFVVVVVYICGCDDDNDEIGE